MEHTAKNRERDASSEMASGRARKRRQGMDELVELIGLPAAIELIRAKGGTSFSVPLGIITLFLSKQGLFDSSMAILISVFGSIILGRMLLKAGWLDDQQ